MHSGYETEGTSYDNVMETLAERCERYRRQRDEADDDVEELRSEVQSLQDASERYVRQRNAAEDEVERLRSEVRGLVEENKELRRRAEQMTQAKKDENNVVELQRELTFKQNTVKQLKAQLERHKQRAKWRGAEYARLRRRFIALHERQEKIEDSNATQCETKSKEDDKPASKQHAVLSALGRRRKMRGGKRRRRRGPSDAVESSVDRSTDVRLLQHAEKPQEAPTKKELSIRRLPKRPPTPVKRRGHGV